MEYGKPHCHDQHGLQKEKKSQDNEHMSGTRMVEETNMWAGRITQPTCDENFCAILCSASLEPARLVECQMWEAWRNMV